MTPVFVDRRLPAVLLVVLATVTCLAAVPVIAEDAADDVSEVWVFTNGELTREVDVAPFLPEVRAAVVKRLRAQGFHRVEGASRLAGADEAQRPVGEAERRRQVRELVRHGGRFPALGLPAWGDRPDRPALRRAWARLCKAARDDPELARALEVLRPVVESAGGGEERPAHVDVPFLGAETELGREDGGVLRLVSVPAGTFAAAAGLVPGDRILALDGRPPSPAALAPWALPEGLRGQRTLVVRRTVGRIEHWRIRVRPKSVETRAPRMSWSHER